MPCPCRVRPVLFLSCLATAALAPSMALAQGAAITLVYDNSASAAPYERMYLAGNWNKTTGVYDAGWQGFSRVPMFDDGQHGDGAAGDRVWGYVATIQPNGSAFQWAVDCDPCGDNGWLGTGPNFNVTNSTSQVIEFFTLPEPGPYPLCVPCAAFSHPGGTSLATLSMGQATSKPSQAATATVGLTNHAGVQPGDKLRLRVDGIDGTPLHVESKTPAGAATTFTIPAGLPEGGHRVVVELLNGASFYGRLEGVHSVVEDVADDVRYGFYANFGSVGGDYALKSQLLVDCQVNALEYYDWFPGHGDYSPTTLTYVQQPFGVTIRLEDIQQKMAGARDRRMANIAYVAAYAAIPAIAAGVPDSYLENAAGQRIDFYNGSTGPEGTLGGVWLNLTAFGDGTPWRAHYMNELTEMLDADDLVNFDGVEIDTYGWQQPYYDAIGAHDGTPMMTMLADLTGDVRALAKGIDPDSLTTMNNVAETGVEQLYDREDFLFIENWAFHKPRYDDTLAMLRTHGSASTKRLVTKCYPADMSPAQNTWPAANLRLLMGSHLAAGGSFMVAGEPREGSGQIGGLKSAYYPDNQAQPAENFAIIRAHNGLDAALFGRNHGPDVRPLATDLALAGTTATLYQAPNNAATWCLLRLGAATHWTQAHAAPAAIANQAVTLTLPNGLVPNRVLYAAPEVVGFGYPRPIEFTVANRQVTATLPTVNHFGAVVVEPMPMATRLADAADDPAYASNWDGATGGFGWSGGWTFSGRTGTANIFMGDSTSNGNGSGNLDADISTNRRAWGMFSGASGLVDAQRNLPALAVGESLRVHVDLGWIANGGVVGLGLRNASGQNVFENYFRGGQPTWEVNDLAGQRAITMGHNDEGFDIEFTLVTASTYSLRIVPIGAESSATVVTGSLKTPAGGSTITRLRLFSSAAGTGGQYDSFFNNVSVYGLPDPTQPPSDWWAIR